MYKSIFILSCIFFISCLNEKEMLETLKNSHKGAIERSELFYNELTTKLQSFHQFDLS